MPAMADERLRLEPPLLPLIVTVALLVQNQPNDRAVYIFPFTGENLPVTWLRIRGRSRINRLIGASSREQRTEE